MIAGESPLQAAQRKAEQEAGLAIAEDRFRCMGIYSTCFAHRQQPPQDQGLHSLNINYQVALSAIEKTQISLDIDEYDEWRWCTHAEVLAMVDSEIVINQALLKLLDAAHNDLPHR